MTLRELLNKSSFKSVFNKINSLFYKDKEDSFLMNASCGYRKVYDSLTQKPTNPNDVWKIYITEKEDEEEKYTDVCFYNEIEDEIYAIDFVPWSELIDSEIYLCVDMDDITTLANILWEITFWGFSETQIDKEQKLLKESKKDLDIN